MGTDIHDIHHLAFLSGALSPERIRLLGVRGREAISRLFEIELFLGSDGEPLTADELDGLLQAPCAIALGPDASDVVHGILRRIQSVDTSGTLVPRYVATMVPTAYLLTLARTNRIFQNLSVPAMVTSILEQYGLAAGEDYQMAVTGSYPAREYVVQYEESDWDFIQRWLETEGIFYWFEHGGERDKLMISDSNECATPIAAPRELRYRQPNTLSAGDVSSVWEWMLIQQRIPARVAVFDYNYRTPNIRLVGKAPVDAKGGFGSVMFYNEHFKTNAEGEALAKVRAERFGCVRRTFSGWSDCGRLRVGHVFELADHFDSANDGAYLITSIDHRAGIALPDDGAGRVTGALSAHGAHTEVEHYKAFFAAIPAAVPYRPERVTPWPVIHGVIHGHVEEDSTGDYAQIDEAGRYKVRFPFDSGNAPGTQASRWIRMSQPYTGVGYGQHHPVHKGAEVLLAHIDGDPDRPIIVGTVPHGHTVSPVTKTNLTQSVTHTPSGLRIELEDLQE
jgi:type VI secretion system secreted protein VgrG